VAERAEAEADPEDDSESEEVPTTALINPVVEPLGDETNIAFEACLSVPDMAGPVRRYNRVRLTYQTLDGDTVTREAEGFHARVLQHECDHLDGVLYPMRVEDLSQFGFVDELGKGQGAADPDDDAEEASDAAAAD